MRQKMYRPYKKPVFRALPDVRIPEPRLSKLVIFLCRIAGRIYLFFFFGAAKVVFQGEKVLLETFRRALAGESRCIIAFRHPSGGEPQLLAWYFLYKLKAYAAKRGVRFARPPHAVFIYGYEVVRWGGGVARFIMPNLGALPISHYKMDSQGMARIYRTVEEGPYPLALAPEGQVSYSINSVPRLEPGTIRIGFQAAERIAAGGGKSPVEILPVSVYLRYGPWGKQAMERLLRKTEKICGFSGRGGERLPFTERLGRCREHILAVNEARYRIAGDTSLSFEERLDRVINAALNTAERMLGIKSDGDFFSRMYKVRQLCWDRIMLPGMEDFSGSSYIERNAMDLQAGEAWYTGRHQELTDFCWYFRIPLPGENAALHSRIEYVQNLWDFANRTMGGAFNNRISVFPRKVVIQSAPAINLSERLSSYRENKKAAVTAALSDLEQAYLKNIREAEPR